jgi:hypothetical protein
MVGWAVELSEFEIHYENRKAIKAQALSYFLLERTSVSSPSREAAWILWVDGANNVNGGGAGIMLESPEDLTIEQSLKFEFKASNNQSKYKALIAGLRLALDLGVQKVISKTDSQLLTNHVSGTYQVKDELLAKYIR